MKWQVGLHHEFDSEFEKMPTRVQDAIFGRMGMLSEFGPQLSRPWVDTLHGSSHANMKELRFEADGGVWRVAFAVDPTRRAVLLVAGDKSGVKERRFYRRLIKIADRRFNEHLTDTQTQRR